MNGKREMVSLLIAQGSNINVMDQNGWTGMHFATKAGHLDVVKLFVMSSADAQAETKDGKVPLCFAAANNHVVNFNLLKKFILRLNVYAFYWNKNMTRIN